MTGPAVGPKKGIMMNMEVENALSLASNRSAFVPVPTASTGAPAIPASILHTQRLPNDFEKPAPRRNSRKIGAVNLYTMDRPYLQ